MATTERVISVEGVALTIFEAGIGGRPLLMIHGFTSRAQDFEDFFDRLADVGWHVIAPDLRGHGSSAKPIAEDDYSLDIFATEIVALADNIGIDRFVILGHSMGGMITQTLVLAHPNRIDGIILMDTSHAGLDVDQGLVEFGVEVARTGGIDAVADVMATLEDDPLATEAYRRMVAEDPNYAARSDRNLRDSSPAMFASILAQMPRIPDRLAALASITAPTLVIVGEQDKPFLDASVRMAETIPGARLAVITNGGHSPQYEAPDEWWLALSTFLAEVANAAD